MKITFSCLALLVLTNFLFAQTKIKEGVVTYKVQWTLPENMEALAANLPTEIKVYFKGDSSSLKSETNMFSSTSILNINKEYERMLLSIPIFGKKVSVIFTPEDHEKMKEQMPELSLKAGTETKTVSGYKALKYEVTEEKSNQVSTAWFTKDVEIAPNSLSRFYNKSFGFPVEFISFLSGITVQAIVKEIKSGPVPKGIFTASDDYEEITLEEFMQMSGT